MISLIKKLENLLLLPLPGYEAHNEMRAQLASNRFKGKDREKQIGAVLIVFWQAENEIVFPLIKRTVYDGVHSGQISLPGGKAEPPETVIKTALREAEEEIGLPQNQVKVIGNLSPIEIMASQFLVTPVVGFVETLPSLKPNTQEVQRILTINLETLLNPSVMAAKEIVVSGYPVMAPYFALDGEIVWGATAMILNELRWILLGKKTNL